MDMLTCMPMSMSTIIFMNLSLRFIYTNLGMRRQVMNIQMMKFLILTKNRLKKHIHLLKARPANQKKDGSDWGILMGKDFTLTEINELCKISGFQISQFHGRYLLLDLF